MANSLQLVWDNPRQPPHFNNDLDTLSRLADGMANSIRSGRLERARQMAHIHQLSPFATAVVATRLFRAGISESEILRIV